jgi:hypothetical protein
MTKARDLANLIAAGNPLSDGAISVSEISDLTASAADLNATNVTTLGTVETSKVVTANAFGDVKFPDSRHLRFGSDNDLAIHYDESTTSSYISQLTSGNLYLYAPSGTISMVSSVGVQDRLFEAEANGAVSLYYDNSKKLTTKTTGIDVTGSVGIGATNTSVFNGVGGTSRLVAKGTDTATNIVNNSDASITIANDDGTANNLAGLHFARADTDDNPHYAGASVVAQFLETQVTGQYPKSELAFLVSTQSNAAPSEKMRINALGADVSGELIADSYNETYAALSGTSPAVNCHNGNVFALNTSGSTTFTFTNPPASGTAYGFTLKVTAGGTHTLTWPSSVDWAGGAAPDAPASGETNVLVFITHDGGTTWYGFQAGAALA